MFEGTPPSAPDAQASANGPFADEELIAFSWQNLVSRLSASQDLREALSHVPATARASFDAHAAQRFANRRGVAENNGKYVVNPVALANGKAKGAKDRSGADGAWPTVRGIK